MIEPHKPLLMQPGNKQLLYKIISVENFEKSLSKKYLHFNRVDSYRDFSDADIHDGEQLPKDRPGNEASKFEKRPDVSVADADEQFRKRTYACCFSLENSDYIWQNYGNDGDKGKVCLVFGFDKLRNMLNENFNNDQKFFINYGIIKYINWNEHQENKKNLLTPIIYAYLKDKEKYEKDKELRITLSSLFGSEIDFPEHKHVDFDFKKAFVNGVIQRIIYDDNCDKDKLKEYCSACLSTNVILIGRDETQKD